jgi:hypothetical protein
MMINVSAAACKHLTEKLMRGGLGAAPRPQRGLGPQKPGLSDKIGSNARF